ncbi:MAG: hypothetical protein NTW19_00845 [Planctomycetota bacterium]|nr:hypothetical protein [Planctomycetota bacterium]
MFWLTLDTLHDPLIPWAIGFTAVVGAVAGLCAWPLRRFSVLAMLLPYLALVVLPVAIGIALIGQSRDISWPDNAVWAWMALLMALIAVPAPACCAGVQELKLRWRGRRPS